MRTIDAAPTRFVVRTVLACVATVGLVAGCGTDVDGSPTTAGPTAPSGDRNVDWNPCTDLADAALRSIQVDPTSKHKVTDAQSGGAAARICRWSSDRGPYSVYVSSLVFSQDEARKNSKITGIQDVRIGPLPGLVYYDKADTDKLTCYVNVPSPEGSLEISIGWLYGDRSTMPQSPPCDLAVEHATALQPFLPA